MLLLPGCGGYGDESGATSGPAVPPLVAIRDVNAWLEQTYHDTGAVPTTYEDVKAAYARTGKPWPDFPSGASWAYFPHQARVAEVRESWVVHKFLPLINDTLAGSRYVPGEAAAGMYVREKAGAPVQPPGYRVQWVPLGSQAYFNIARDTDERVIRGNFTANRDFEIDKTGNIVIVPHK